MGYPVISDSTTTPEVRPTGVTVREAIVVETDYEKLVPTCIDTRAVKVKIEKIDIPVGYAAAFEGERVRKDDMHVQFGYKYSDAVEYVHMVDGGADPGRPDRASTARTSTRSPEGGAMPLVDRSARGRAENAARLRGHPGTADPPLAQPRHGLHAHRAARPDLVPHQQESLPGGLRLKHLGTILYAKLHGEYGGIVDKVAVRIDTAG